MATLIQRLQRHPFPVVAHFERVVAVSFAFPEALLHPLLPAPLVLDTYEGWGFVTVALVWTRGLRPVFLPPFLGQNFFLAGYRIFARLTDSDGRRLRGLKILRSETDQARMVWSGNLLTHYNYRRVLVDEQRNGHRWQVRTRRPDGATTLDVSFDTEMEAAAPPAGSPFADWHAARRFAGPMPFTFDDEGDGRFVIIEGSRADWTPRPIAVERCEVALFQEPPFREAMPLLANAFAVENVAYRWARGRVVTPGNTGSHD
ncbi:MAG: DUF2071 domain-containing protein [Verrucomicrobia bacterium]|nr:DUF2071 domain-containing protein [Verrucomicrobiota bacterium]